VPATPSVSDLLPVLDAAYLLSSPEATLHIIQRKYIETEKMNLKSISMHVDYKVICRKSMVPFALDYLSNRHQCILMKFPMHSSRTQSRYWEEYTCIYIYSSISTLGLVRPVSGYFCLT
jgi:hypothetical protein